MDHHHRFVVAVAAAVDSMAESLARFALVAAVVGYKLVVQQREQAAGYKQAVRSLLVALVAQIVPA